MEGEEPRWRQETRWPCAVQAGLQNVAGGRSVKIVADVVLARPHDLHGRARVAGDKGGLNGILLNKATAKATTDECDVGVDALARNPERTSNGIGGGSRELRGGPEVAGHAANVCRALYGSHRCV